MKILIHDISCLAIEKFSDFKNLEIVNKDIARDFMKEHWHQITDIFDSTSNHYFYNSVKKDNEEFIFKADINFMFINGKKYYNLPSLNNFEFANKKENFSEEDFKEILKKKDSIEKTLSYICGSYKHILEKELEELDDKVIDISELVSNKEKIYFVKDKKKYPDNDNILDFNSLLLLKDLKEILENKI